MKSQIFDRTILSSFRKWRLSSTRKSLIIKGARQVGKSYAVRQFAGEFKNFVEINFERSPQAKKIFNHDLQATRIVKDLEIFTKQNITPGQTLLFLDEIQECPLALKALRYFYEDIPSLHVVAAGSLLQFIIDRQGVPVGRVQFMHMFPLSFREYLQAADQEMLLSALDAQDFSSPLSPTIHSRSLEFLREYFLVGGMPEAVKSFLQTRDLRACQEVQNAIVTAYQHDFHKYTKNSRIPYVSEVFSAIPQHIGTKFVYSKVRDDIRSSYISDALQLLTTAEIAHKVHHSSGNGIPLAGERDLKKFKAVFVDIGLAQRILGTRLSDSLSLSDCDFINKGGLAEQFVGQELLAYRECWESPELFYWHRESRTGNAEVNYLLQYKNEIVPLEVKSGKTGKMKSLQQFFKEKQNVSFALKVSPENNGTHGILEGKPVHSLPLYALWRKDFLR